MAHLIEDRHSELIVGIGLFVLGSWLIYDAYEGRNRQRPFALRFLPG